MVYDDDTKMVELLMEAISFMSNGKSDLARAEADPVFKLLKFNGDAEQMDTEWCSWTTGMLSLLELHEIVKSYEVSLAEVEEWVNDLRIWFERANVEEERDPKRGKKRSLERESSKDTPAEKEVVGTSETDVAVKEEVKKAKKKRKTAASEILILLWFQSRRRCRRTLRRVDHHPMRWFLQGKKPLRECAQSQASWERRRRRRKVKAPRRKRW